MSHHSQMAFVARVKALYPDSFVGKRVLEIGSFFVNGSVRQFFDDCEYVGADVAPGPCVDLVCPDGYAAWARQYQAPERFDTVISAECLEHCADWQETLVAAYVALKTGGLMVLTMAGPGRQEHGTRRTSPADSLLVTDYYRNLSVDDLRGVLTADMFSERLFDCCLVPADTYFAGVKK